MTYRSTDGESRLAESTDDISSNPPSTRVAYRLSEESGKGIEELRPLAESVDPEALDAIFADRDAPDAYVTFQHEGFTITVTGNDDVLVDPIDAE